MQSTDIEALGQLLAEASGSTGAAVQGTHEAIAQRTFDALGGAAEPVRRIHDGIAAAVYRGVRGSLRGASIHGSRAWAKTVSPGAEPLEASPAGLVAIGAINGIWGDFLEETGNALTLTMTVRSAHGDEVAVDAASLAAAHPDATGRIAVFLHGLCETELAWKGVELGRKTPATERPAPFGERLRDDLDVTSVYVRFNSGARISRNGRELSALLEQLTQVWPVPVDEFILVGHSMGGLIARSACHHGDDDGLEWTRHVRHVFCLGAPHLGADLEKGVHLLDWALGQIPETRALGGLLRRRSVGVKDLRFGAITDADWHGHDPDEFLRDRCQEVPFLESARYYFVGAQLTAGTLGRVFGDLLVREPSASGKGRARQVAFEIDHGVHLPGLNHFDLLTHNAVYTQLREWIERAGLVVAAATAASLD